MKKLTLITTLASALMLNACSDEQTLDAVTQQNLPNQESNAPVVNVNQSDDLTTALMAGAVGYMAGSMSNQANSMNNSMYDDRLYNNRPVKETIIVKEVSPKDNKTETKKVIKPKNNVKKLPTKSNRSYYRSSRSSYRSSGFRRR